MRVLVKEPNKNAVVREIGNRLKDSQAVVGGNIEILSLTDTIDMYCNEEGLLQGLEPNDFTFRGNVVLGTVFFASHNDRGDTVGINDDELDHLVKCFEYLYKYKGENTCTKNSY